MVRLRSQLHSKLQKFPTSNTTIELIDHLLFSSSWNLQPSPQDDLDTQQLMEEQLQIPLNEFSKGWLVKEWTKHQKEYLSWVQSPRTANKWTQTLLQELWNIFFQMWLHRNEAFHSNQRIQDNPATTSNRHRNPKTMDDRHTRTRRYRQITFSESNIGTNTTQNTALQANMATASTISATIQACIRRKFYRCWHLGIRKLEL